MSLKTAVFLTKSVYNRTCCIQSTSYTKLKFAGASVNSLRYYAAENTGKPNDSGKPKTDILGRFFPAAALSAAEEAARIKQEQENFEKQNKEKNEENEKSWRRMKIGFAVFGGALAALGGVAVMEMGAPRRDELGQELRDEFSDLPAPAQYLRRAWSELSFFEKMIVEPSREKLLPDPLPAPYQPTFTLVLEFTDVLVHPDWSYQTGWRFKKRPGVDQFLQAVASSDFEVIIFTAENAFMIWPVIDKLDPDNKYIAYRLFRDSTHFVDGMHVKNLDNLNRDLSKVIVVDWNKEAVKFHPQNVFAINKWRGADDDTQLIDLANLLQTIAMSKVSDVRPVLSYYAQFADPVAAFRDNQRRLLETMELQRDAPPPALPHSWLKNFSWR